MRRKGRGSLARSLCVNTLRLSATRDMMRLGPIHRGVGRIDQLSAAHIALVEDRTSDARAYDDDPFANPMMASPALWPS